MNSLIIAAKKQPIPFGMVLVEETSRLARNPRNVLDIVDALSFHGVHIYFIDQNLDSRPEMVKEEYITRLSDKVRRGQIGPVINGFPPGGRWFGYRSASPEAVPSYDAKGRITVLG